ncbi:MAG: Dynamin-related GTPase protein, partial [Paramarteilia canceri]
INLTVVDTPGLVKIAVNSQVGNISSQIDELILNLASSPETLILAVMPANNDLANSGALQMALRADKDLDRTIGVITKIDMMDAGTDASDILNGKIFNLKKGFVGVVNRNFTQLKQKVSHREARKLEKEFFKKHPAYNALIGKLGSNYLQSLLSQELLQHINIVIPGLIFKLNQ